MEAPMVEKFGSAKPPEVASETNPLYITFKVGKTAAEDKSFRVTGPEYYIMHQALVPAETPREGTDKILTEWVGKHFPYSEDLLKEKLSQEQINSYPDFISLMKAVKTGEIDGVVCKNSAAVLLGLLTKGKGEGGGYHIVGFADPETHKGHVLMYDYAIKKYLDPQAQKVLTFDELQSLYSGIKLNEEAMEVFVPGKKFSRRFFAATGQKVR